MIEDVENLPEHLERLYLKPECNGIGELANGNGNENKELVLALVNEDELDEDGYTINVSLIDHNWCKKILELVSNKARLKESFSWLSTVGGGFSALGERDSNFSMRAGALSLGQQLRLAELLGDERLKVMCHLFAALASIQMDNKQFCINYIKRVIVPLIKALPYRDPVLMNMFRHICFRIRPSLQRRYINFQAIEGR